MCNVFVMFRLLGLILLASTCVGCSSLGITLWPSQFPLLKSTKTLAASSPLPAGLPNELDKKVVEEYYIEPGDRVLLEAEDFEFDFDAAGDQEVQVDGSLDLGEYGRLRVAGLTVEAIEQAIEERIFSAIDKRERINVRLLESNASQIYILGQVGAPGAYPLLGSEHVLDAILEAGGLTSEASPCDIILVRPTRRNQCRVVLPICYRQITQVGDVSTNYQLQPGDRIVVGTRTLCEELAFWKQSNSCRCCCQSSCSEKSPEAVNYDNRLVPALNSMTTSWLPRPFAQTREAKKGAVTLEPITPTMDSALNMPIEANNIDGQLKQAPELEFDDDDVFLPPLDANAAPKSLNSN